MLSSQSEDSFGFRIFEFLYIAFILSFAFLLGMGYHSQIMARAYFGGGLLVVALWFYRRNFSLKIFKNPDVIFFGLFILFELVRALWGYYHIWTSGKAGENFRLYQRYTLAPIYWWAFYFAFFLLSYVFFKKRSRVIHLLSGMSWCGLILSLNAIPPLLGRHAWGFITEGGRTSFFYPPVYFHDWIARYVLGTVTHPNYMGDVLAFGMFAATGLSVYALMMGFDPKMKSLPRRSEEEPLPGLARFFLYLTFALVSASAIFLFFSRGTIVSLAISFAVFIALLLIKYRSVLLLVFVLFFSAAGIGFLFWAGNLQDAWKEVQTLESEMQSLKGNPLQVEYGNNSIFSNREGARRALKIYKDYKVWGAGTHGYSEIARKYATSEAWKRYKIADFQAMNHYLHLLAEEGSGAYLYFLTLAAYLQQILTGLFKTRSRFIFVTVLSLFGPVFLVLSHASIIPIMQGFAVSVPVYILMGASLGILSSDFDHRSVEKESQV